MTNEAGGGVNVSTSQGMQAGKAKEEFLPKSLQKEHSPDNTLVLARDTLFRLLISKTVR